MSTPLREAFARFVRDEFDHLIRDLSGSADTGLAILDHAGTAILRTRRAGASHGRAARARRGRISVPIEVHDEAIGSVVVTAATAQSEGLASSLAAEIARRFRLEFEVNELSERLAQSFDEINLLFQFSRLVHADEAFSANASRLLRETGDLLDERLIVVNAPDHNCLLWSAGSNHTLPQSLCWLLANQRTFSELCGTLDEGFQGDRWRERARETGTVASPFGEIRYALVPIWIRSQWGGYAGMFQAAGEPDLETGELRLLQCLAHKLGTTATTQKLHQEIRGLLFSMTKSLVAAIEAKDEYTRGHSERVYDLSIRLGQEIDLSCEDLQNLSWAALLHDIGKLAIPDSILLKPSRLTEEEYAMIRTHPERGCRVLEPIPQMREILPFIRHHHERYDGKGYPAGLKGDEIPLISRIIAVADTYDAMASARPYRAPRTMEFAVHELQTSAGSQLDPMLTSTFLRLIEQGEVPSARQEAA